MAISKTYDPSESEDKWYKIWTDQGLFNSEPDDRESYTAVSYTHLRAHET